MISTKPSDLTLASRTASMISSFFFRALVSRPSSVAIALSSATVFAIEVLALDRRLRSLLLRRLLPPPPRRPRLRGRALMRSSLSPSRPGTIPGRDR